MPYPSLIVHPGTLTFYLSKMKKFLHFGMVIVIVLLFFCVKCDENKKSTFSKVLLLLFEYIWLQSTKIHNWKKKQKKKCWSKFRKKRRLLAEWLNNAWIIALLGFFSKFLLIFLFFVYSFNSWFLMIIMWYTGRLILLLYKT